MTKTMTEREFLTKVIASCEDETIKEYAQAKIQKLDDKNKSRKETLTKTQKENEVLKGKLLEMFQENSTAVFVASEIATQFEISTQKASALCRQLAESDKLTVTEVKVTGKGKVKGYQFKNW